MRTCRPRNRSAVVAIVVALVAFAACKKDGEGPDKQIPDELKPKLAAVDTSKLKAPPLFAHVPADTPYVLASFEPVSLDYYAKMKDGFGSFFSKMVSKKKRDRMRDDYDVDNPSPAASDDKLFDVIVEELSGKMDAKGFESLGLSATPRFALYGLGLAPVVFRIEIKDEKVLMATIERIATKAGKTLPPQETKDGKSFWRHVDDDATAIIGIIDNHLVVGAGPTKHVEPKLGLILGTEKPAQSMSDGKALMEVMTKHGFGANLIGYVDTRKIAAQAVAFSDKQLPQLCIAEIDRIAAKVPRLVLGYTEISAKRAAGGVVIELEPGLLAEVAALKTEVPGLGAAMSDKPLMAFGGGIDLAKGQALLVKTAGSVGKLGDLCQSSEMARKAGDFVEQLNQPLPEPLKKITGAVIALHTFKMGRRTPEKLDGFAMVTASSAKALFDFAKSQAPPISQMGISADGKLNKLSVPAGMIPFDVYAGVGEKAIVMAAGDKGRSLGEKGMNGSANGKAPFLVATYDYGRFAELQAELEKMNRYDDGPEDKDMADLQKSISKLFDRGSFSVDVNDKGLVMWGALDMK